MNSNDEKSLNDESIIEQEILDNAKIENNDQKKKKDTSDNDELSFGWNQYAEITNGRFAMLGFIAIIAIELISKNSFLNWAGILN
tara:strand:- start:2172 stop:2426 length:255 start_codon:yes stop_codon:yes gene_type:complete